MKADEIFLKFGLCERTEDEIALSFQLCERTADEIVLKFWLCEKSHLIVGLLACMKEKQMRFLLYTFSDIFYFVKILLIIIKLYFHIGVCFISHCRCQLRIKQNYPTAK